MRLPQFLRKFLGQEVPSGPPIVILGSPEDRVNLQRSLRAEAALPSVMQGSKTLVREARMGTSAQWRQRRLLAKSGRIPGVLVS